MKLLSEIAEAARDVRDERDRHLHRGEERALAGDMDMFFKLAAMSKPNKSPKMSVFSVENGNKEVTVDLNGMHTKIVSDIRHEYHEHGDTLIRLARELFDAVDGEFVRRWSAKRDRSTDVRDWEKRNSFWPAKLFPRTA